MELQEGAAGVNNVVKLSKYLKIAVLKAPE